jgi:phosphohistidine swiveling domain-containing protein
MQKNFIKNINPEKYILTFKANGVSVFVTDIHRDVYLHLKALFTISSNEFKQYFTKIEYEKSLSKGLKFYNDIQAVKKYKKNTLEHCKKFTKFFNTEIKNKKQITQPVLRSFFSYTKKLCKDYTKMNVEFTDKAFLFQDKNIAIKQNLKIVSKLKDKVRVFMNAVLFEATGFSAEVFKILSKQLKLDQKVFENLTQTEILSLFKNQTINKSRILNRQNVFVSVWNNQLPIEGREAKEIIVKFEKQKTKANIVFGQIANKGKVVGEVKIIPLDYGNLSKVNSEIEKMKIGNILIAETTAPELIVACRKAKAIVTDLGGLMSHAAIVSREFKIPCIVGTKIATKVFKDGDLVEVDANKGIVRKIK